MSLSRFGCMKFVALAIASGLSASLAFAQDAAKQSHSLRLPEFTTDKQEYCRLVLPGSETPLELLIVRDGSILYVDRNGNGDLTETTDRVQTVRNKRFSDRDLHFRIGEIRAGNLIHQSIELRVNPLENYDRNDPMITSVLKNEPGANAFYLSAQIQHSDLVGSGNGGRVLTLAGLGDRDGILQFGNSIEKAPTIQFVGQLEVRLYDETRLRPGAQTDVVVAVGTAGIGPGTFAAMAYENVIPESVWPQLTLETKDEQGQPVFSTFELKHRC